MAFIYSKNDVKPQKIPENTAIVNNTTPVMKPAQQSNPNMKPQTAYQANMYTPIQQKQDWNTRNVLGQIYTMYDTDPAKATDLLQQFNYLQGDKNSRFYNPYNQPTNRAVSNLAALGFDTNNLNDNWWNQNQGWVSSNLLYNGTTNTPSSPGKKATADQKIAYELYQWHKSEETTRKAEQEWQALQDELSYWAKDTSRNYSDDQIYEKVCGKEGEKLKDKYPTLAAMNKNKDDMQPTELNRAIDYSTDAMYGVMWAARNPEYQGNIWGAMANSALGTGNQWVENPEITAKLNWYDERYSPYSVGMTLEQEGLYFDVPSFGKTEIERLKNKQDPRTGEPLDPNDSTAMTMRMNVLNAEEKTVNAESELRRLNGMVNTWIDKGWSETDILSGIEREINNNSPILKAMDESRSGDPNELIQTTRAIDYRKEDLLQSAKDRLAEKKAKEVSTTGAVDKIAGIGNGSDELDAVTGADPVIKQEEPEQTVQPSDKKSSGFDPNKMISSSGISDVGGKLKPYDPSKDSLQKKQEEIEQQNLSQMAPTIDEIGTDAEKIVWDSGRSTQYDATAEKIAMIPYASKEEVGKRYNARLQEKIYGSFNDLRVIGDYEDKQAVLKKKQEELANAESEVKRYSDWYERSENVTKEDVTALERLTDQEKEEIKELIQSDDLEKRRIGWRALWNDAMPYGYNADDFETEWNNSFGMSGSNQATVDDFLEAHPKLRAVGDALVNGIPEEEEARMSDDDYDNWAGFEEDVENLKKEIPALEAELQEDKENYNASVAKWNRICNDYSAAENIFGTPVDGSATKNMQAAYDASRNFFLYSAGDYNMYDDAIRNGEDAEKVSKYAKDVVANDATTLMGLKKALENKDVLGLTDIEVRNIEQSIRVAQAELMDAFYYNESTNADFAEVTKEGRTEAASKLLDMGEDGYSDLTKLNIAFLHNDPKTEEELRYQLSADHPYEFEEAYSNFWHEFFTNGSNILLDDVIKSKYMTKVQQDIEDVERDRYFYLLKKYGEDTANAYFNHITNDEYGVLLNREHDEYVKSGNEIAAAGGVEGAASYVASFALNMVGNVQSFLTRAKAGGDIPNQKGFGYWATDIASSVREGYTQHMVDVFGKENEEAVRFLMGVITSQGDSYLNSLITNAVFSIGGAVLGAAAEYTPWLDDVLNWVEDLSAGNIGGAFSGVIKAGTRAATDWAHAIPMAIGAAENAYHDAITRGATPEQAQAMARVTFFAESLTEAVTYDNISDMWARGASGEVEGIFKELFKDHIQEAIGEGINQYWEDNAETIIMGNLSTYNQMVEQYMESGIPRTEAERLANEQLVKNIITSAASGFVGSQLSGSFAFVSSYAKNARYNNIVERATTQFRENALGRLGEIEGMGKQASSVVISSVLRGIQSTNKIDEVKTNGFNANAAAQHLITNICNGSAEGATQAMRSIISASNIQNVTDVVESVTYAALTDGNGQRTLTDIAQKVSDGFRLDSQDIQNLLEAVQEDRTGENAEANDEALKNNVKGNRIASNEAKLLAKHNARIKKAEAVYTQKDADLTEAKNTLEKASAELEAKEKNREAATYEQLEYATEDGLKQMKEADAAVIAATAVEQQAQAHVDNMQDEVDKAKEDLDSIRNEDMSNVREQAKQMVEEEDQQIKDAAEQQKIDEENKTKENARNETAMNAFNADVEAYIRKYAPNATAEQKDAIREAFQRNYKASSDEIMDREKIIKNFTNKFGYDVKIVDTTNGGSDLYADGYMDENTNTIYIDNNTSVNALMWKVLGHEITHIAEQSGTYDDLANALLSLKYGEDINYRDLLGRMESGNTSGQLAADILAKKGLYDEKLGKQHTNEQMLQEVVADAMGDILNGDQDLVNQLVKKDPGIVRRIIDSIKSFIKKAAGIDGEYQTKAQQIVDMLESALKDVQNNTVQEPADEKRYRIFGRINDPSYYLKYNDYKDFVSLITQKNQKLPIKSGGYLVDMKSMLIYADDNDIIREVLDVSDRTVNKASEIKDFAIELAKGDTSIEGQREIIDSLYDEEGSAFRSANYGKTAQGNKWRTETQSSEYDSGRDREEVSPEAEYTDQSIKGTIWEDFVDDPLLSKDLGLRRNRLSIPEVKDSESETITSKLPGGTIVADITTPSVDENGHRYSLSSWTPKEISTVRKNLLKNGFTEEQADGWISDINSIAAVIAADKERLDFEPDRNQKFKKPNGDVYKWTLDASTLCAKRLLYQGTFNAIQKAMPNTPLYAGDLIELSNMMREMGYQTPCGICYVESQRRDTGKFTEEFINNYAKEHEGEFIPTFADLTTSDGLYKLRDEHKEIYDAYIKANNARGSGSTKPVQLRTDYRGDVRSLTKDSIAYLKNIGGLRIQSFSDFETPHLMDMMQAVLDMSAVGLTSQAYTKVPNFAWVFGDTGIKINLSLMGEGTGVDENGNLIFSSTEGMDFDEAMKLRDRYSQNVGTILVGMNDAHILAAMADPRIDYIIPFHRSGWSEENRAKMTSLANYKDYQDYQNERDIKTGKKASANIEPGYVVKEDGTTDGYWDYNKTGRENAEAYLKLCAEKGLIPKFDQFLVNNGDGSYSLQPDGSTDGYWKLLIDFKMYDNDGNGAPQQAVTPNINMPEAYRVLSEFDGTGVNSLPVAQPVVDRYLEEYQAKHPLNESKTRYSLPSDHEIDAYFDDYIENMSAEELDQLSQEIFGIPLNTPSKGRPEATSVVEQTEAQEPEGEQFIENARDAYIDAVNNYDMETAQKIIDQIAKKAGYTVRGTHRTNANFTVFQRNEETGKRGATLGNGFYIAEGEGTEYDNDNYGKNRMLVYVNPGNVFDIQEHGLTEKEAKEVYDKYFAPFHSDAANADDSPYKLHVLAQLQKGYKVIDYIEEAAENANTTTDVIFKELGYDSIKDGPQYCVFDSSQIKLADPITYNDKGYTIDPDNRFDKSNPDIRYSLPSDAPYLSAVNHGDMEEAQKMVDEKAKEAGYTDRAYHGTPNFGFTQFNTEDNNGQIFVSYNKRMAGTYAVSDDAKVKNINEAIRLEKPVKELRGNELIDAVMKYAPYFNGDHIKSIVMKPESTVPGYEEFTVKVENKYGEFEYDFLDLELKDLINEAVEESENGIYQLYTRPGNQLVIDADGVAWDEIAVPFSEETKTTQEIGEWAKENGYDSVRINNVWDGGEGGSALDAYGDIAIFFNPNDVKSADTITYNDNGDVIPLSERFKTTNNDIRYSLPSSQILDQQVQQYLNNGGSLGNMTNLPGMQTTEGGGAQRQFGHQTAQTSEALHDEVKDYLYTHSDYIPETNQDQIDRATDWVKSKANATDPDGYYAALDEVTKDNFDYRSADGQARMLTVMSMAALKGDTAAELRLADAYNQQGTDLGRQLQARKIFRLMTPLGRRTTLQQEVARINQNYKNQGKDTRVELSDWLLKAAEAAQTEEDFEKVRKQAERELAEQMPSNWKEKLQTWRMLSMLANPRTHIRNILGNLVFAPTVGLKNVISTGLEAYAAEHKVFGHNLKEGERTKSIIRTEDAKNFAKEDAKVMKNMLTGEAKYTAENRIDREKKAFGQGKGILSKTIGRGIQAVADANSWALEAEDWLFLNRHYQHALASYMSANNLTSEQMTGKTLENARNYAILEAQKATYRDANKVSDLLNKASRNGGIGGFLVDTVLPFKKTPANILRRGIEYSPIGLIKTLATAKNSLDLYAAWEANGKKGDMPKGAKSMSQVLDDMASGLTGLGISALGALGYALGAVKLSFGGEDDDDLEKLNGSQEYSIELFGHSFTIDWMAPVCMPFFTGAALYKEFSESVGNIEDAEDVAGLFGSFINSLSAISEPIFNLSMLDGVSSLLKSTSYSNNNRIPIWELLQNIGANYVSSLVPSGLGAVARTMDTTRRQSYVEPGDPLRIWKQKIEQTQNKIPYLSEKNIPYRNVWGEEDVSTTGEAFLENFILPGYLNKLTNDKLTSELQRIYDQTGDNSVIPKMASKTVGDIKMTDQQYDKYVVTRGQTAKNLLNELIERDEFIALTPTELTEGDPEAQVQLIGQVWTYANQVARHELDPSYKMTKWVAEAYAGGNVIDTIFAKEEEKAKDAYATQAKNDLFTNILSQDAESINTSLEGLRQAGKDNKTIRTDVMNYFRDQYKQAYANAEIDTMNAIMYGMLYLDLGEYSFTDPETDKNSIFNKWIKDMDKE